jgi:hypothetical protein
LAVTTLKTFLDATLARISGKSAFAGAIRYSTSRWKALTRFVDDGRLEMSNAAERAIRPLGLGRKNYLFAGSDAGGRRAALMYTLIETAKMNDVDPEAWPTDVGTASTNEADFKYRFNKLVFEILYILFL